MSLQATTFGSYDIRKRDNVFEPSSNESSNNINQSEEEGHNGKWPPLGCEAVSNDCKSSVQLRKPQVNMTIDNNMNFETDNKGFSGPASGDISSDMNSLNHILPKNQIRNSGQATDTSCDHNVSDDANVPVCKNCLTSTTPLWRRDEHGAVLCNACGLFLKLHGKPRPISLKTDVIKSRNRKSNTNHAHNLDNFRNQTLIAELKSEGTIESSNRKVSKSSVEGKKKKSSQSSIGSPSGEKVSKKSKTDPKDKNNSHLSAKKLEVLMSGDSSRPKLKPKLSKQDATIHQEKLLTFPSYTDIKEYSNSSVKSASNKELPQFGASSLPPNAVASKTGADSPQLPHLSMLLGSLNSTSISNNMSETVSNSNNGIVSTAATLAPTSSRTTDSNPSDIPNQIRSTMSSPDIISAKRSDPTSLSFHMASINDMLETKEPVNSNVKTEGTPPHLIPLIQSSKVPYLSTAHSLSVSNGICRSDVTSERNLTGHPIKALNGPLSTKLHKEEEIIKLKTRINELELVTDLYRRHINELDGKCRGLEERLERAEKRKGDKSR